MKHSQVMKNLKNKLNEILDVIPPGSKVVYLDYPFYLNVGDILIYKGTESFFKENNIDVVLRMNVYQFDVDLINNRFSDCIVVCQGGGNFGDIYDLHQNMRRELVGKCKNKIVILPQSIHYGSNEKVDVDSKVFSTHEQLYFYVRDEPSFEIAKKFTKNVILMPDMAHYLWNKCEGQHIVNNFSDTLYFIRKDCEQNSVQKEYEKEKSYDWNNVVSGKYNVLYKILSKLSSLVKVCPSYSGKIILSNSVSLLWKCYTDSLTRHSIIFFDKFDHVITSRLHGHILSCLLSIKSEVIDNSYGKNSRYINVWTRQSDIVSIKEE